MTGIVAAHRGNVVNRMGDGMLATFDGPARAVHYAASLRGTAASLGTTLRSAWVACLLGLAFGTRAPIAPGDERRFGDATDGAVMTSWSHPSWTGSSNNRSSSSSGA